MKIVIIDHEPYTERKRVLYYMDNFIAKGVDVEYWSVVDCIPYMKSTIYLSSDYQTAPDAVYIKSYSDLLERIKNFHKDTVVILEVELRWNSLSLFKTLNKSKIKYIRIDYYINTLLPFGRINILEKLLNQISLRNIIKWTKNIFFFKLLNIADRTFRFKRNALLFLTGSKIIDRNQEAVSLNYFDVEVNALNENKPPIVQGKYIVFLDINLPSHPDNYRYGFKTIALDIYYKKMNSFFDLLEQKTGLEVIIAAHPHSDYTSEYGTRQCLRGKTALLVKHCEFAVLHDSTSLNFALLNNKPMMFVYFDEFISYKNFLKELYIIMKRKAAYFESPIINIDNEEIPTKPSFSKERYLEYLNDYVYSSEYPKTNFEIVEKELTKLMKR